MENRIRHKLKKTNISSIYNNTTLYHLTVNVFLFFKIYGNFNLLLYYIGNYKSSMKLMDARKSLCAIVQTLIPNQCFKII
jgi:hypothetical protein